MEKIVISRPLPGPAVGRLRAAGYQVVVLPDHRSAEDFVAAVGPDVVGLIPLLSDPVNESLLARAPKLRAIANYAVGYNNVDLPACTKRGIPVTNTPDVLTEATADLTLTLILMCFRRIPESMRFLASGRFDGWKPELMLGRDPQGKTLGIIGMGRIGRAVARRAAVFGLKVVYFTPSGVHAELPYEYLELEDLLKRSDVVSPHVPLTEKTKLLLDERRLRLMKKTAVLVNTSRGPVIDEDALVRVMKEGHLFAAGLDVYAEEPKVHPGLWELENAVLLPHIGSSTLETRSAMADLAVDSLVKMLRGERPANTVNPQVFAGPGI